MIRLFWLTVGILSLSIGIIGIFLPLLPTVPLVLFAAIAFAKSSPSLHSWLINHKFFGSIIKNWQGNRKIPFKAKFTSVLLMLLSLIVSIIYLTNR